MSAVIVLPTQLFEHNELIKSDSLVYLIEHPTYFTLYKYHKMKLVMHRATLKYYENYIKTKYKCKTKYIEFNDNYESIFSKHNEINIYDPIDYGIHAELVKLSKKHNTKINIFESLLFFIKTTDLKEYLNSGGKINQVSFYSWLRKKYDILTKYKLSYDKENRLPFPNSLDLNDKPNINTSDYVLEAKRYVTKHFDSNIGDLDYYLPIDHKNAKKHLDEFVNKRLSKFGPYEDASNSNIVFGYHSVLSPLLNIGLITDLQVIDAVLHKNVPIQSKEGFIRQITGWRNIMHLIYIEKYDIMKESNYFNHTNKLPKAWYSGTTGIIVIDDLIKKVIKYAYLHHIERLMFIGNFMLLSKTDPNDVFKWFMALFIDAYDWVMVGNVYAMSQYSTGSLLMKRPYFSSSNYIAKMSNYKKVKDIYPKIHDREWFEIWDALYYNFIYDNKKVFATNYATASAVKNLDNKPINEVKELRTIAHAYLKY